jgi:hypothetical protein
MMPNAPKLDDLFSSRMICIASHSNSLQSPHMRRSVTINSWHSGDRGQLRRLDVLPSLRPTNFRDSDTTRRRCCPRSPECLDLIVTLRRIWGLCRELECDEIHIIPDEIGSSNFGAFCIITCLHVCMGIGHALHRSNPMQARRQVMPNAPQIGRFVIF